MGGGDSTNSLAIVSREGHGQLSCGQWGTGQAAHVQRFQHAWFLWSPAVTWATDISPELDCCWAMQSNMVIGSSSGPDNPVVPVAVQLSDTNIAKGWSLDSGKQISILKSSPASHLLVANVVGMRTKAANNPTADSSHSGWGGPPVSDSWWRFFFNHLHQCTLLLYHLFLCSWGCILELLSLLFLQEGSWRLTQNKSLIVAQVELFTWSVYRFPFTVWSKNVFLSCKSVPICALSIQKILGTRHMSDYGFFQILKYLQIHEISWGWEPSLGIEIHWFYMSEPDCHAIKKCEFHFDYSISYKVGCGISYLCQYSKISEFGVL